MTKIGIVVHHTAGSDQGDAPSLKIIRQGRKDLPGPLANYYVSRSGQVVYITSGRANHAGKCSSVALQRMQVDLPPLGDAKDVGLRDDVVGNVATIGIEIEHPGDLSPWPEQQIAAVVALCAQLCQENGWTANRVWHHREITRRKPDMSYRGPLREMIAARLAGGSIKPNEKEQSNQENDEDMATFYTEDEGQTYYYKEADGPLVKCSASDGAKALRGQLVSDPYNVKTVYCEPGEIAKHLS